MSSITIQQKGITDIPADAIVNAANSGLWAGGGVCGAIFRRAGYDQLTAACNEIGHCPEGSAVITPGFDCPCKFIIHAVGPEYNDGKHGEPEALYGAYAKSLELCRQNEIHSVVFPLISAGIFGYPLHDAWTQAIRACKSFIEKNLDYDLDIIFAIPETEKLKAGNEILQRELQSIELEYKQLKDKEGILLYEGFTLYDKPYRSGKSFFSNGNVYQEGEFGIKGLIKGKEYYSSGKIRFEGTFNICHGYGPNFPVEGKCYDENGNLYYEGKIECRVGGVGYRTVIIPAEYGPIPQTDKPDIQYFMWEDEKRLKGE